MTDINYDFGANAASISDIQGHANAIQEVQNDIDGLFKTLASAYDGDGATALQAAHNHVNSMLTEAGNNTLNTQKQAQDQQDTMQALDRANAQSF